MARRRTKSSGYYMISVVARRFNIHPQTLRLYEREGLIKPARSSGNTRLYDQQTIRRIEVILTLTRDMGVNLAGVEVILNLREQIDRLQSELSEISRQAEGDSERRGGVARRYSMVKFRSGPLSKI